MNRQVLATETSCIRRFSESVFSTEDNADGKYYADGKNQAVDSDSGKNQSNAPEKGAKVIGLTLGEPDFRTPEAICQAAKTALDDGFTHYPKGRGVLPLRKKISEFERKNRGLRYSSEEIIITNGATEAVASIFKAILNHGDEVIVPTPAFGLYRSLIELYGGKCVALKTFAENGFQITLDGLQSALSPRTKCIVLNYPNNPTGVLLKRETAKLIYEMVKARDIFVLCDEVYDKLVFNKEEENFGLSAYEDLREKIIIAQSFSKTYAMTGWRVGYIMADLPIADEIFKIHQYTVAGVSHFSQLACIKALECNVEYMSKSYEHRTVYAYERLSLMGMEALKPQGSFYIFPSIKRFGMSSSEFCERLAREQKLLLVPGWCFEGENHVRISCCYDEGTLQEAMDRLEAFIKNQSRI